MFYKVKPEYADLFGDELTDDTIISETDVEMFVRGWETTKEKVLEMLEEIKEKENKKMEKNRFLIRQVDAYWYDEDWTYNTTYNIGRIETGAKNERKAFTNFLKKNGIVFKKNRTLIEYDGNNYTIVDRKTKEPLFDMVYEG